MWFNAALLRTIISEQMNNTHLTGELYDPHCHQQARVKRSSLKK
jgi:hypothetical protein